jgi:PAS domain S-box-containing protein
MDDTDAWSGRSAAHRRDLLVTLALLVVSFVLAVQIDAFDVFATWSRRHEQWHLDEVIALSVAGVLFALHSWRGHRALTADANRLLTAKHHLAETSQRYQSLFTFNPQVVYSLDLEGRFVEVNRAGERTSGYTESELTTMHFLDLIHPADHERSIAMFVEVLERRPRDLELSVIAKDGTTVELHVTPLPVVVDGEVVGTYGAEQVADRNRMLRQLQDATRAAEAASEAKSFFLANMSHEIRTPLTSLLASRELLEDTDLDELQARLVQKMDTSGTRLLELLESILDFSRIEAGAVEINCDPFELRATVGEVVAETALAATERGLTVRSQLDPALPERVVGDPERLQQVLRNLLDNAVKFTPHGGIALTVRPDPGSPSASPGAGGLLIEVEDTGIGIDLADQASLFDSFSQVDPSMTRRYEGSGLGLAICRQLVVAMGGDIWVESSPGTGSTFSFRLPLRAA